MNWSFRELTSGEIAPPVRYSISVQFEDCKYQIVNDSVIEWPRIPKSRAGKPRNFLQLSDNDVEFCRNVVQATARFVLVSLCVV